MTKESLQMQKYQTLLIIDRKELVYSATTTNINNK
jgi:hypothetical protein